MLILRLKRLTNMIKVNVVFVQLLNACVERVKVKERWFETCSLSSLTLSSFSRLFPASTQLHKSIPVNKILGVVRLLASVANNGSDNS